MNTALSRFNNLHLMPQLRDDFFWPFEKKFNEMVDSFFTDETKQSLSTHSNYPRMNIVEEGGKLFKEEKDISFPMIPEEMSKEQRSALI